MEIINCQQLLHQRLISNAIGRSRRKWKREMRWYPIKQNCVYSGTDRIYKETLEKNGQELYKEMAIERRLNKRLFSLFKEKKEFDIRIDLLNYGELKKVETTSGEYGHLPQYKYETCARNKTLDKYEKSLYKEFWPQERRLVELRRQELKRIMPDYADSSNHEYGNFPKYKDNSCGPCPRITEELKPEIEFKTVEEKKLACKEKCDKQNFEMLTKVLGSQVDILKSKSIYPESQNHLYGYFLQFAN